MASGWPHLTLVFVAVSNAFLTLIPVGYQMTVLNNPQFVLEGFVNTSVILRYGGPLPPARLSLLWSFIVSCLSLGGWTGCFLSVPLREVRGLKAALMIYNNFFLVIGCGFFGLAWWLTSFECLIIGRLILGVYSGCGMALVTAFIQECSPPEFRGMLSCVVHIGVTMGAALAPVLGVEWVLGGEDTWVYLLIIPSLFALMQWLFMPLTHESPKCLHERMPNCDEAYASVRYYYGPDFEPRDVLKQFDAERKDVPRQKGLFEALGDAKVRWGLTLAALINFCSVFTGVMALISYSTVTLESLGLPMDQSQEATASGGVGGGALAIFFTLPTLLLIEKTGRRKLFLPTFGLIAFVDFCLIIFGTLIEEDKGGTVVQAGFLLSILVFLVSYNIGPGPIQYFIPGELAPENYRTAFLAVGVSANWFGTLLSTLIFYPLNAAYGSMSFLLFFIPTFLSFLLFWWKLPETKTSTKEILSGDVVSEVR